MQLIALTCWTLVVVLTAWGVHRLWCGIVKPKVIDAVLLPGTLLARLGHVLGLLITGGAVRDVTLLRDSDSDESDSGSAPQTRIPIVGPAIVALLPLALSITAIYLTNRLFGAPLTSSVDDSVIGPTLPQSIAALWQALRDQITLVESLVAAIGTANPMDWRTWALLYLLICLVIRVAPATGCLRSALGGITLTGLVVGVVTLLMGRRLFDLDGAWIILNITQATALLLLLIGLIVRGTGGLVRIARNGA